MDQLGRGREAVPLLERFLSLWSDVDAAFIPFVTDARERLARIRAGQG